MKVIEQDGYLYLGILEMDRIMRDEMRLRFKKKYFRRLRIVMKTRLNRRNKIQPVNTWAVARLKYGAGIVTCNNAEVKNLDRKNKEDIDIVWSFPP